ncbi:MAG TPA: hypothetical protein VE152_08720 [Acidimicrobiales bacterium]|jgi:probable HAF family extracellular repeat protein|nr:hypothetical protein [Acidimicrobiales bacterium]
MGVLGLTSLFVVAAPAAVAHSTTPSRTWINLGPGQAFAVNDRGQIVGRAQTATGPRAVMWQHGGRIDLGTLGGGLTDCTAQAINDRGQVAGTCSSSDLTVSHAFLWFRGRMTDLGTLGGSFSGATALNSRGDVAGESQPGSGGSPHAFLWSRGRMADLGTLGATFPQSLARGINNRDQVVGWSTERSGVEQAFLRTHGAMTPLSTPMDAQSEATAINDRGQIAGTLLHAGFHPVMWRNQKMTVLPTLGGDGAGLGINQRGVVVGWVDSPSGGTDAALWSDGRLIDLGSAGGTATIPNGVNDRGDVVGRIDLASGLTDAVALLRARR